MERNQPLKGRKYSDRNCMLITIFLRYSQSTKCSATRTQNRKSQSLRPGELEDGYLLLLSSKFTLRYLLWITDGTFLYNEHGTYGTFSVEGTGGPQQEEALLVFSGCCTGNQWCWHENTWGHSAPVKCCKCTGPLQLTTPAQPSDRLPFQHRKWMFQISSPLWCSNLFCSLLAEACLLQPHCHRHTKHGQGVLQASSMHRHPSFLSTPISVVII